MRLNTFFSLRTCKPCLFFSLILAVCVLGSGCSTPPLKAARSDFHAGRFYAAERKLDPLPETDKDEVLFLMERGMIRQELGMYEASAEDWRKAADIIKDLETYSVSKGAASLVSNDRVLSFKGKPFEKTLLYTFLAKNYIALGNWDFAGISGRNIIEQLENLDDYPDIAYSRYVAGVCMELMNDSGNAAIQYLKAQELAPWIVIDPKTGFIFPAPPEPEIDTNDVPVQYIPPVIPETPPPPKGLPCELICFIGASRGAAFGNVDNQPQVDLYYQDRLLGRSYVFSDTESLMAKTIQRELVAEMAKTAARIAAKEAVSQSLESQNQTLGSIVRFLLYAMEAPDDRRWETLPKTLSVARVYCPEDLSSLRLVFKNSYGGVLLERTIEAPLIRRGRTWFAFCRDIELQDSPAVLEE